jgi:HEAT repeat protein
LIKSVVKGNIHQTAALLVQQLQKYGWADQVKVLGAVGSYSAAQELMCDIAMQEASDAHPQHSSIVSIALQNIPDPETPNARSILFGATRSPSLAVVNGALRVLAKLSGDDVAVVLQSFLSHPSAGIRAAATAGLTDVQPERLRNWIPRLATDDDAGVRLSILRAMYIHKARDWLVRRSVIDEDMEVRFAARQYLQSLEQPRD